LHIVIPPVTEKALLNNRAFYLLCNKMLYGVVHANVHGLVKRFIAYRYGLQPVIQSVPVKLQHAPFAVP